MIWNTSGHTLAQWGIDEAHRYLDALTTAFGELTRAPKAAPAL